MPFKHKRSSPPDNTARDLRRIMLSRPAFAFYAGIPFVLTLALGLRTIPSKSGACGFCHTGRVRSWSKSAHATVACNECHHASLASILSAKMALCGTRDHLVNIKDSQCKSCHSKIVDTVDYNGQHMPHSKHVEGSIQCVQCHRGTGHGQNAELKLDKTAENCRVCHSVEVENKVEKTRKSFHQPEPDTKPAKVYVPKTTAISAIEVPKQNVEPVKKSESEEKTKPSKPESHKQADWIKVHGNSPEKSLCASCHGSENTCSSCHGGVLMPHPSGWVMNHKANGASFADDAQCFKCHDKKIYCGRCHSELAS